MENFDPLKQLYPYILDNCDGLKKDLSGELTELGTLAEKTIQTVEDQNRMRVLIDTISARIRERIFSMSSSGGGIFIDFSPVYRDERDDEISFVRSPESSDKQMDQQSTLEKIEVNGTKKATAIARLFLSPWSSSFAHGPDTLLPVGELAEKILKPGEKITTLKRVSWRAPMTHDLDLTVVEGDQKCDKKQQTLDGVFETDQGRAISFMGQLRKNCPIAYAASVNPLAAEMICLCPEHRPKRSLTGTYKAQLMDPPYANIFEEQGAGMKFATLAEIITIMMVAAYEEERGNATLKLLGGINDLTLPESLSEITGRKKLELKFDSKNERPGGSGLNIIPFSYKFPHQKSSATGITAYTESEDLADKHCGRF